MSASAVAVASTAGLASGQPVELWPGHRSGWVPLSHIVNARWAICISEKRWLESAWLNLCILMRQVMYMLTLVLDATSIVTLLQRDASEAFEGDVRWNQNMQATRMLSTIVE